MYVLCMQSEVTIATVEFKNQFPVLVLKVLKSKKWCDFSVKSFFSKLLFRPPRIHC